MDKLPWASPLFCLSLWRAGNTSSPPAPDPSSTLRQRLTAPWQGGVWRSRVPPGAGTELPLGSVSPALPGFCQDPSGFAPPLSCPASSILTSILQIFTLESLQRTWPETPGIKYTPRALHLAKCIRLIIPFNNHHDRFHDILLTITYWTWGQTASGFTALNRRTP